MISEVVDEDDIMDEDWPLHEHEPNLNIEPATSLVQWNTSYSEKHLDHYAICSLTQSRFKGLHYGQTYH
ncbi:unnamed protein product [Brachionus calyciflorus]|uniref:Uncharacterized protein n=1 Tax=Brachionus calyciflorus TaxID=104777 RepID=A0A813S9P4_9BILA|nr:unnamed protein product [Brachionus calyciflorus]